MNNQMPRRTSTKEASYRDRKINVMAILSYEHPQNVDDYAIQMYYKANNHNPFFKIDDKRIIDNEVAEFIVNGGTFVKVNIRTGVISESRYNG